MIVGDGDQVPVLNTSPSSTWHCQKKPKCCLERMMNNELCKQAVYCASQSTETLGVLKLQRYQTETVDA